MAVRLCEFKSRLGQIYSVVELVIIATLNRVAFLVYTIYSSIVTILLPIKLLLNGKLCHYNYTPASVTKASSIGGSMSKTSFPNVLI